MPAVKTVLALAQNNDASESFLKEAAAFAARHEAHLIALTIGRQETIAYAGLPDLPPSVYADEMAAVRARVEARMAAATQTLTATGVSFEVRGAVVPAGEAGRTFAAQARYADIALLPRDADCADIADAALNMGVVDAKGAAMITHASEWHYRQICVDARWEPMLCPCKPAALSLRVVRGVRQGG